MADVVTTMGMDDREFAAALGRASRRIQQFQGQNERSLSRVNKTIGDTARVFISAEAIKQIGREAINLARGAAEHNSLLAAEMDRVDAAVQRVRQSLGEDIGFAITSVMGSGKTLIETLEDGRRAATNFIADIFSGTGHSAAIDDIDRLTKSQDALNKAMRETDRIRESAAQRRFAAEGRDFDAEAAGINAERAAATRRIDDERDRIREVTGAHPTAQVEDQLGRQLRAEMSVLNARSAALRVSRRRAEIDRRISDALVLATGSGDRAAIVQAQGRRSEAEAVRRVADENRRLGILGTEARSRMLAAAKAVRAETERQTQSIREAVRLEAERAAATRRRELLTAEMGLGRLRAETLRLEGGDTEAAELLRELRLRQQIEQIRESDAFSEQQKQAMIRETTELIRRQGEAERSNRDAAGRRTLIGGSRIAARVFGPGRAIMPTRRGETAQDIASVRSAWAMIHQRASIDRLRMQLGEPRPVPQPRAVAGRGVGRGAGHGVGRGAEVVMPAEPIARDAPRSGEVDRNPLTNKESLETLLKILDTIGGVREDMPRAQDIGDAMRDAVQT